MNVRAVTAADRDAWLDLRAALWPDESKKEMGEEIDAFLSGADSQLSAVFVSAGDDGRLTGFVELFVRNYAEGCSGDVPCVEGWYIVPEARGKGVGADLMRAAEQWARDHGFRELASDALLDNHDSHRAHAALGFEEVERTVHFRKSL